MPQGRYRTISFLLDQNTGRYRIKTCKSWSIRIHRCSYRSWKTWKVMEFKHFISQAWKFMEFNCRSLKLMEN